MSINKTQNPSRVPSTSASQSRQNIVEILAGTTNGSLSELGCFPDLPQRFKELEDQNAQWRLENTKLYQDNACLLGLIREQNEHIKEICAPDSDKNIKIMELNSELQKTRMQRDELAKAQTANSRTPSQLQQDFTRLQGDYMRILNGYRSKCTEVERLQNQIRTQFSSRSQPLPKGQNQHRPQHQPQQQAQQQSRPQVQQHPQHQLQQQFQQQSLPQIQQQSQPVHQLVHVQRPQANHPAQWQLAPSLLQPHIQKHVQQQHSRSVSGPQQLSPPVFGQVRKQKNPLSQTQQAVFDQRRQAIPTSQHPRQSSGNVPGQEYFANMVNPQRQPPLLHNRTPSSSRPNSEPPHSSTSSMVSTMSELLATRPRTSLSNSTGHPTQVVSPHFPFNQLFFAPPSSGFNQDLPQSNMVSSTPIESNTSTYVPLTVSPLDTYLITGNQVPSPQVKDVQGFETSTSSFGTSISPVASQPVNVAPGISSYIPPHQMNSLKRESPTEFVGHHDVQKRARLESYQLEPRTNNSMEPIADGTEDTVQMDNDKDEVVEVGPDGLRLVNDCISDLFGEEAEGEEGKGRYCKLCSVRRTMGYVADSPKPFVNATNDELQEHCMTEHAEAWDTLRQTV